MEYKMAPMVPLRRGLPDPAPTSAVALLLRFGNGRSSVTVVFAVAARRVDLCCAYKRFVDVHYIV